MANLSGKCPNCGKENVPSHSDHYAVENFNKYRKTHPLVTGALGALYGAKRIGLIPSKCPKCGTTFWAGGAIKSDG
jgi:rRNA maturation protein Nop10